MTDIISMLAQAQNKAQNENNSRQQNDSVASFFNSIKQPSTNTSSLPIQIKQNTLESIERNVIPSQDTQNNNASQNDLSMANSPLAKFLNSKNYVRTTMQEEDGTVLMTQTIKGKDPVTGIPTFSTILQSMPAKNLPKETTKLITPNMLTQSNNANNNISNNANNNLADKKPEALTKNQILQALKYLIEYDDDFSKKVHEAYLKSLKN